MQLWAMAFNLTWRALCIPLRHSSLHADAFDGTKGSYLSVVFFVLVTMLGMYIVLSLFVSILLERFGDQDAHKFEMEEQGEQVTAAPSTLFCFRAHACVHCPGHCACRTRSL